MAYTEQDAHGINLTGRSALSGISHPIQRRAEPVLLVEGLGSTTTGASGNVDIGNIIATGSGRHIRNVSGTYMALCAVHDVPTGGTVTASPVVVVYGKVPGIGWVRLKTIADTPASSVTITYDKDNDPETSNGSGRYTTDFMSKDTIVDLMGCNEIVATVTTAANTSGTEGDHDLYGVLL